MKLIEWYDLDADPAEKQNLVYAKLPPPDVFQEARAAIELHHVPPCEAVTQLDAEQAEQLRALGYVDDSPPE